MNEIWKDITNYEKTYQVSNLGKIRSKDRWVPCKGNSLRLVKGKVRKIFQNKNGYIIATLCQNNKLKTFIVHQLVCQAFLPNFIKGTEINHKDGIKSNNIISNLEKSNPSHNQLHAYATGLSKSKGVSKYYNVSYDKTVKGTLKKWIAEIRVHGKQFGRARFENEIDAAKHVDYLLDSINDLIRKRNFPTTGPTTIP
tara:strand:+ start:169 stop:759 length:591 start_codon:yes stop_codon:yes gene_type:complete